MAFNETLAKIRQDKGITQEQLAHSLYVTRQAVSRWETGETLPNIDMCKLIARELDVPISTLLEMPEACLCQSCGMPLSNPTDHGCEKDGSASDDYCKYCYDQGSFTYDATMDELIESCAAFMAKKANISVDEAVSFMGALLPTLKRWNEIQANERTYGKEARMRYGDKAIDEANERLMTLTDEEWNSREKLEGAIIDQLKVVMEAGPESPEAADLATMHKRFIELSWGEGAYSTQAHLGLADGYLADKRFVQYYDSRAGEGATEVLVAALKTHLQ